MFCGDHAYCNGFGCLEIYKRPMKACRLHRCPVPECGEVSLGGRHCPCKDRTYPGSHDTYFLAGLRLRLTIGQTSVRMKAAWSIDKASLTKQSRISIAVTTADEVLKRLCRRVRRLLPRRTRVSRRTGILMPITRPPVALPQRSSLQRAKFLLQPRDGDWKYLPESWRVTIRRREMVDHPGRPTGKLSSRSNTTLKRVSRSQVTLLSRLVSNGLPLRRLMRT